MADAMHMVVGKLKGLETDVISLLLPNSEALRSSAIERIPKQSEEVPEQGRFWSTFRCRFQSHFQSTLPICCYAGMLLLAWHHAGMLSC